MNARDELIQRFDAMRNSGICSPTTRGLLDDAQALLDEPGADAQVLREAADAIRDDPQSIDNVEYYNFPKSAEEWLRDRADALEAARDAL